MLFLQVLISCAFSIDQGSFFSGNSFSGSSNDDERAVLIAESATNKIDECFEDLGSKLNSMCINLDANKRKSLTISIMICEHNRDGRSDILPQYYEDDDDFISQLDNENFKIFTTLYTSIDSVCFHAAHEHLSTDNLQKILNVYNRTGAVVEATKRGILNG